MNQFSDIRAEGTGARVMPPGTMMVFGVDRRNGGPSLPFSLSTSKDVEP